MRLNTLGLSLQGFLQLRYQQSPLKSVEPATLSLTIAPIDVIYSQLCLLRLVNFLNAAWPPPNLVRHTCRSCLYIPVLCGKRLMQIQLSGQAVCRPGLLQLCLPLHAAGSAT